MSTKVKLNHNGHFLYCPLDAQGSSIWMVMKEEDGSDYDVMWARCCTFPKKSEVRVGSGTTAPALTDYCLANELNTLTKVTENIYPNLSETGHKAYGYYTAVSSFSVTYRNDTNADITVNEIGVFFYNGSPVTSYGDDKWIMFARGVLDAPVTIGPGETYTFSVTIE